MIFSAFALDFRDLFPRDLSIRGDTNAPFFGVVLQSSSTASFRTVLGDSQIDSDLSIKGDTKAPNLKLTSSCFGFFIGFGDSGISIG